MALHTYEDFGKMKYIPMYGVYIVTSGDELIFRNLMEGSTYAVRAITQPVPGGNRMVALRIEATIVVGDNDLQDKNHVLLTLATKEILNLTVELEPLPGQEGGATMTIAVSSAPSLAKSLAATWDVVPTHIGPSLQITIGGVVSIDYLTLTSLTYLFTQHSGWS
jgi:hypothetical protein